LIYSRIYRISPALSADESLLDAASPASNQDEMHEQLFDQLRSTFHTHSRRQFGRFAEEAEVFPPLCQRFEQEAESPAAVCQHIAHQARSALDATQSADTCYLWCVLDGHGEERYFYLFLLEQEQGVVIADEIRVKPGYWLNPSRLQYAMKINLTEWPAQSTNYLTFLSMKNQQPKTLAWNAFVGFAEAVNRVEQTAALLNVVEQFAEVLPPQQEKEYRAKVVEYCMEQDRSGEPVALDALSRYVNEAEPEAFYNFVQNQMEEPATALHPDRNQLKRYSRVSGRAQDFSISFSSLLIGSEIVYDEQAETLIIKSLPKSLKAQIKRHLKGSAKT